MTYNERKLILRILELAGVPLPERGDDTTLVCHFINEVLAKDDHRSIPLDPLYVQDKLTSLANELGLNATNQPSRS